MDTDPTTSSPIEEFRNWADAYSATADWSRYGRTPTKAAAMRRGFGSAVSAALRAATTDPSKIVSATSLAWAGTTSPLGLDPHAAAQVALPLGLRAAALARALAR